MTKINHGDFTKKVFKKGNFKQFIISPYASTERLYQKVLIFSDKVSEPTVHLYRRQKMSLILPYTTDIKESIENNLDIIKTHTGIHATYFGLFDFEGNKVLTI